ncbi:CHAT domain-containing protein [Aeromicrobium duanguangcaii]|uniref:CHAT domain-containing protein n=1 Tax=Aeromicrobium duanguangcaii TaxID=2968086 RepID=A0ABY5KHS9_9ACTN|nr:CHAT domain-containing protein [Aeromicrobium duanguangcaii]MCD9153005.1 CHAT domain-containing protein [Aeromicrobium duanguangcaii]UUI69890.1 CHAT domain-containing protein [Aeromicrobium duanguangcaii]
MDAGRFRTALRLLATALERNTEPDLAVRIMLNLSHVESALGDQLAALRWCDEAARLADTPPTRALVHSQRATLHLNNGDAERAAALYDLAVPALTGSARANALMNRGVLHLQQWRNDLARRDFQEAARLYDAGADETGWAQAMHNDGYAALQAGELVVALEAMDTARGHLADLSPVAAAVCDQDIAEALLAAGQTREAVGLILGAARVFAQSRLRQHQGECEATAARVLLFSDPRRARRLARQAARRLRGTGSEWWALRADTVALAAEASLFPPDKAWLDRADETSRALRQLGLDHPAQLLDLLAARQAVTTGDLNRATALLRRGRTTERDSLTERLLESVALAARSLARGRRRQALADLRRGLDLLHHWQSTFGSLDLASGVAGSGRALALTGIRVALASQDPALVFEWSERTRELSSRVVPVRPPHDPELAADLSRIRRLTITEPEEGSPEADELSRLRGRVRHRVWLSRGSGQIGEVVEPSDLVSSLGAEDALVSYVWDRRRLHALVITDDTRVVIELGPQEPLVERLAGLQADLDMAASRWNPALANAVRASRDRRLTELARMLVDPVLSSVGDRRLVITPAGLLSGLPWSMLPGFIGRPVTVPVTATRWLATRGVPVPQEAAFVAGPDVARAIEEVKQSAARWPGAVTLTDDAATVAATLHAADGADLLHVSAHGRHAVENPLFSGVLLADGPLFGYDLDRLAQVPDVVILSACEVGRSTQRWAEESLGMVNAWLHAGARCVIASPAAVADDEACEVLQDVHRLMAGGTPPGVALAEATADRPTSFVCFGAGW